MIWFAFGLVALVLGAELLVRGASKLVLSMGTSPLIVPLVVHQQVIRQEVPVMIGASLLIWALAVDGGISRWDGFLLAGLVVTYTLVIIRQSRRETAAIEAEYAEPFEEIRFGWDAHWGVQVLLLLAVLALLVLGSRWLVEAAVAFAQYLGVSELVIGLTVVAVGTSLPEVATSIMVAVAVVCLPVFFNGACISRGEGALFLGLYAAYTLYLFLAATKHDALIGYSTAMGEFVLPVVAVGVLAQAWRYWKRNQANSGR